MYYGLPSLCVIVHVRRYACNTDVCIILDCFFLYVVIQWTCMLTVCVHVHVRRYMYMYMYMLKIGVL